MGRAGAVSAGSRSITVGGTNAFGSKSARGARSGSSFVSSILGSGAGAAIVEDAVAGGSPPYVNVPASAMPVAIAIAPNASRRARVRRSATIRFDGTVGSHFVNAPQRFTSGRGCCVFDATAADNSSVL